MIFNHTSRLHIATIYIIIFTALFCHGISLKKNSYSRGDLNPRRWSQSTDMLGTRPSHIPKKGSISISIYIHITVYI